MKHRIAGCLGAFALLAALPAHATTFEAMSFGDMVSEASACVVAEVQTVTSEKRDGQVVTLTTFKVEKAAFGSVGELFTVVTPGGSSTMGNLQVSEVVAGAPRFFNDQSSLMLLSNGVNANEYEIVGLNQGLFNVSQGVNGANLVVLPVGAGERVSVDEAVDIIQNERANPTAQDIE